LSNGTSALRGWHATGWPVTLSNMTSTAPSLETILHRLLEGILLRLSRGANAGEFILRGGMLMRHWFRPLARPAGDLDLVATFPFTPRGKPGDFTDEATRRFLPILADQTIHDGVTFDLERTRAQGIWLETTYPGVRVFTSGVVDGTEIDFNVDIASGPYPRPDPVFGAISTACGEDARIWMCRPETIVGQKMQALCHLGMLSWRPKDLNDLRLLLIRLPMENTVLREAIAAYMADLGRTTDDARTLFGPSSWWSMKLSSARWFDFAKASCEQEVPKDLAAVVAEVAARLVPVLEGLP